MPNRVTNEIIFRDIDAETKADLAVTESAMSKQQHENETRQARIEESFRETGEWNGKYFRG